MITGALLLATLLSGADPLLGADPGELQASEVGTAPLDHLLDERAETGRAERAAETLLASSIVDPFDEAWLLGLFATEPAMREVPLAAVSLLTENPLMPGHMMDDPAATHAAAMDLWAGFPVDTAAEQTPTPLAEQPMPAPMGQRLMATGVVPLQSPVVPADLLPASRVMLGVTAGLGAVLAGVGVGGVLLGQYLFALVGTRSVQGRARNNAADAAGVLTVGGGLMILSAVACGALSVTAVLVGVVAQQLTPGEKPAA